MLYYLVVKYHSYVIQCYMKIRPVRKISNLLSVSGLTLRPKLQKETLKSKNPIYEKVLI